MPAWKLRKLDEIDYPSESEFVVLPGSDYLGTGIGFIRMQNVGKEMIELMPYYRSKALKTGKKISLKPGEQQSGEFRGKITFQLDECVLVLKKLRILI